MTSARRLARWGFVAGALAGLATVLLVLAAFDTMSVHVLGAVGEATRYTDRPTLPIAIVAAIAAVGGAIAASSLVVGGWTLVSRGVTSWRFMRVSRRFGELSVADRRVLVVPRRRPEAFCAGLLCPRVFVSEGALDLLGGPELEAVVAHEAHHARRRDPLRMALADALAEGWFLFPALRDLSHRYSRLSELDADDAAVLATRTPRPLAAALLVFELERPGGSVAPERVDRLLGVPASERWPARGLASAAGVTSVALSLTALLILATGCTEPELISTADAGADLSVAVLGGLLSVAVVLRLRAVGQRLRDAGARPA